MAVSAAGGVAACTPRALAAPETASALDAAGAEVRFEVFDAAFEEVVDTSAPARLLSPGHWWSEGPAWDAERQTLYFTDVPRNCAYSWSKADGDGVFLSP